MDPLKASTKTQELNPVKTEPEKVKKSTKDRHKQTRKRLEQVNAASKRCRQRQKEELRFLRVRVKDLEEELQLVNQETANLLKQVLVSKSPAEIDNSNAMVRKISELHGGENELAQEISTIMDALASSSHNARITTPFPVLSSHEHYQALLGLIVAGQAQANISKTCVESHFTHGVAVEHSGWNVKTILTHDSLAAYTTKFYPNVQLDHLENDFLLYAIGSKPLEEKVLYKYVHNISEDSRVIDARNVAGWTLLPFGKTEIAIRLLLSKWKCEDHCMVCFNSLDIPDLALNGSDCLQYASNGWLQLQPKVVDGIVGTMIRRYATFGFSERRGNSNHLLSLIGLSENVVSTLFEILDDLDGIVVGSRDSRQ